MPTKLYIKNKQEFKNNLHNLFENNTANMINIDITKNNHDIQHIYDILALPIELIDMIFEYNDETLQISINMIPVVLTWCSDKAYSFIIRIQSDTFFNKSCDIKYILDLNQSFDNHFTIKKEYNQILLFNYYMKLHYGKQEYIRCNTYEHHDDIRKYKHRYNKQNNNYIFMARTYDVLKNKYHYVECANNKFADHRTSKYLIVIMKMIIRIIKHVSEKYKNNIQEFNPLPIINHN